VIVTAVVCVAVAAALPFTLGNNLSAWLIASSAAFGNGHHQRAADFP
jgi:hypothetical protein